MSLAIEELWAKKKKKKKKKKGKEKKKKKTENSLDQVGLEWDLYFQLAGIFNILFVCKKAKNYIVSIFCFVVHEIYTYERFSFHNTCSD